MAKSPVKIQTAETGFTKLMGDNFSDRRLLNEMEGLSH
jgi:hypothetical protein